MDIETQIPSLTNGLMLQLRTPDGKQAGRISWTGDWIIVRLVVPPTAPEQWGSVKPLNTEAGPPEHRWWRIDYSSDPPTLTIEESDHWLFAYHNLLVSDA